ncbi:class II aldolase/adducin family protein [Salidesulfovibrio onnuriiensis]|uniref:class II aldolase/adducin family protein n=1 Tax=Salidesulfovibrio onnuriiensis TaxID=2583823 RepID=UPI0011C83269|nr:class II aldolase/adducin family protein [Salidesulfovibrio onnuriiensis]
MKQLVDKYAAKLAAHGLAEPGDPLVGGLDDRLVWNRRDGDADERIEALEQVFDLLSINSLVFSRPGEPYRSIIDFLCTRHESSIRPEDCETRTFLHDIPIMREFSGPAVADGLRRRKAVIIPGHGIASSGTVTPEQGFVFYSSTCFACFVLFFSGYLEAAKAGALDSEYREAFKHVVSLLPPVRGDRPQLMAGPLDSEERILAAMAEAGRAVVGYGLVDSFFGNISVLHDGIVYISQTGSSLDELEGCIDPCPQDGSSCAGLTASSELTAHDDVYRRTRARCILHGHPRFSVIMSMDCDKRDCPHRGQCHIRCSTPRRVGNVPIVPGEVGTGPTGLCNTLPPALEHSDAAIVHGHGLFTTAGFDFNQAFKTLLDVENACRNAYFQKIEELG